MDKLFFENTAYNEGSSYVCGIDEAGRGPLAGPVFAAAVILPKGVIINGVDDSKKLSAKKRELLSPEIKKIALAYSIATASVEEIETLNILNATMLAMERAFAGLNVHPDTALIDGNHSPNLPVKTTPIIKGDSLSASIACASILAKVARDKLMLQLAEKYPEYSLEKHKGYGTKLHISKIREFGPSPIHRPSFLKKILGDAK